MTVVRRSNDDPVFRTEEPPVTLQALTVRSKTQTVVLQYYRSTWRRLSYDFDNVRYRATIGKMVHESAHIGSFEVREFRCKPLIHRDSFFEEMDSHSHETSSLADAVCSSWSEPSEVTDYGDIIELSRTWISPTNPVRSSLALAIPAIIRRLIPKWSLAILKAFPLEYEGLVSDENRAAFLRRQRAMIKHYQKQIDFVPPPGARGQEGWMYCLPVKFTDLVPEPDLAQ